MKIANTGLLSQVYEVVRPLVSLLNTERDGLQNYEALLGLTNFSGRSDKLRWALLYFNLPSSPGVNLSYLLDYEDWSIAQTDQFGRTIKVSDLKDSWSRKRRVAHFPPETAKTWPSSTLDREWTTPWAPVLQTLICFKAFPALNIW